MTILQKKLFVILIVIVVITALGSWFLTQPKQSLGQVKFSINRSVIKQGENATITVTVENTKKKEYSVEYRFNVNKRVRIYEGAEELLPQVESSNACVQYIFNYTLEATIPSETRVFVVTGILEEGMPSITYSIALIVYFDGRELEKTWNDLSLKVEK